MMILETVPTIVMIPERSLARIPWRVNTISRLNVIIFSYDLIPTSLITLLHNSP